MPARFFREYILQLVVGVSVTATVAVVALVYKLWNWPNAIVGGVLLLCGALYLMDRLGIGPSLKSRVRDWLDSSGYSIQTIQDSNEFHFIMTDNVGIVTDILQLTANSPILIVSAKHKATPEQLAAFNAKPVPEQGEFWKNVRLELLRYGIQFSTLCLDGDGVSFSENVFPSQSLTSTEFLKRLLFVRSGARLYWELLGSLYNDTPSSPSSLPSPALAEG
jgi:hypothetical protein